MTTFFFIKVRDFLGGERAKNKSRHSAFPTLLAIEGIERSKVNIFVTFEGFKQRGRVGHLLKFVLLLSNYRKSPILDVN